MNFFRKKNKYSINVGQVDTGKAFKSSKKAAKQKTNVYETVILDSEESASLSTDNKQNGEASNAKASKKTSKDETNSDPLQPELTIFNGSGKSWEKISSQSTDASKNENFPEMLEPSRKSVISLNYDVIETRDVMYKMVYGGESFKITLEVNKAREIFVSANWLSDDMAEKYELEPTTKTAIDDCGKVYIRQV